MMTNDAKVSLTRPRLATLIFNPASGMVGESPAQLLAVISALQAAHIAPAVYLADHDSDLASVVRDALALGIDLFVVCGGDGTIEFVADALAGSAATLGIIPTGTWNNVALSLNIPADIPAAVALLQTGRRLRIDLGRATCGDQQSTFMEAVSVGLLSALYSPAEDIRHGHLLRLGDLLAALVTFPPSTIHLLLDGLREITVQAHVVLVANLPFIGPHYQIGPQDSYEDGLLDVVVFANISKLDLLSAVVENPTGLAEDPRIQHFRVAQVDIVADPPMPVMADGLRLGDGAVRVSMQPRALTVMAGELPPTDKAAETGDPPGGAP